MFIVNYENGKTLSESQMSWDSIPKDGIVSVRLKWDSYDFVKALNDRISQFSLLINSGQQFKAQVVKELESYSFDIESSKSHRSFVTNSVCAKAREVLDAVLSRIDRLRKEAGIIEGLRKSFGSVTNEDQNKLGNLVSLISRAESNRSFLNMVILDMESFNSSDTKIATLVGSSKHKYLFWQDKVAYYNLSAAKDLGPFEQRIGMVIDPTGKTIVCEMNLRTGSYKTYVTTIDSLKLDKGVFSYIYSKLSEVT